jgi:integral membrane protein (TIGR01906 family)
VTGPLRSLVGALIAAATVAALVGLAIPVFLNPAWIGFEQGRSGAAALNGYDPGQLASATNAILHDLILGPPDFAVEVDGAPVLVERERAHMRDVRGVFGGFAIVALGAAIVVLVAALRWRRRRWFLRSVGVGGTVLVGAVVALGAVAVVAFDPLFELFHRIFFPPGSYTFDPATERLVRLFPDAFWFETTIALGVVIGILGAVVAAVAFRSAGRAEQSR